MLQFGSLGPDPSPVYTRKTAVFRISGQNPTVYGMCLAVYPGLTGSMGAPLGVYEGPFATCYRSGLRVRCGAYPTTGSKGRVERVLGARVTVQASRSKAGH